MTKYYWFTEEIEARMSDSTAISDYPTDFAFVPDYDRLIRARDLGQLDLPDLDYSELFENYSKRDAVSLILEMSEQYDILVLNESHHYPSHREFARRLLLGLKSKGYMYLGIETLTNYGDFLQPEYPRSDLGYYSNEPTFANFIREALSLGFILFPYEDKTGSNDGQREIEQAQNVYSFIQKNNQGKVFLYCGYDHNLEGDIDGWGKSMTGRLEDLTQKEVLTINQTYFNEIPDTSSRAFVLVDSLGLNFSYSEHNDVFVFHPDYLSSRNKVEWKKNETNEWRLVDFIPADFSYPLFVKVYLSVDEVKSGVPYDIVELKSKNEQEWIVLPKGQYVVVLENLTQKEVQIGPNALN